MSRGRRIEASAGARLRRGAWALGLAALLALLVPDAASGCAVCYGAADSPMTAAMNNGILTLLGVVGVVQAGFVALFVSLWLRGRRLERLKNRFTLIRGGR